MTETTSIGLDPEVCRTCLTYLHARWEVLKDPISAIAARSGRMTSTVLHAYMLKVHARHLAGDSIDFPVRQFDVAVTSDWITRQLGDPLAGLAPSPVASPITGDRRPCRACRSRKRRRGPAHHFTHQIGDVQ